MRRIVPPLITEAMRAGKGHGKEAKLTYHGHLTMEENRNGLVVES